MLKANTEGRLLCPNCEATDIGFLDSTFGFSGMIVVRFCCHVCGNDIDVAFSQCDERNEIIFSVEAS